MAPSRGPTAATAGSATTTATTSSRSPPLLILDSLGIGQEVCKLTEKVVVVPEQPFHLGTGHGTPIKAWNAIPIVGQ